ncbi:MAG: hypothetical protein R3F60_27705 [bacterium]
MAGLDADGVRVFQPRAERQSDVARAVLYFSVRWGAALGQSRRPSPAAGPSRIPSTIASACATTRIQAVQGNRNPFVDCPALLPRIPDFIDFPILDADLPLP